MSVVLGIVPVIAAWLYSEYLRYTKHSISAKAYVDIIVFFFFFLMSIGKDFVKEDDKALLIEDDGGGLQSSAPKAKASSARSPLIRLH